MEFYYDRLFFLALIVIFFQWRYIRKLESELWHLELKGGKI